MWSLFSSNYPTVLITEGDTWGGFYAAHACLKLNQFEKVIVAVQDKHNDFTKQLEKLGAHIRKYDPSNRSTLKDTFKDVNTLLLIPPYHSKDLVKYAQNIIEIATTEQVKRVLLWSKIGVSSVTQLPVTLPQQPQHHHHHYQKHFEDLQQVERLVKDSKIEYQIILRIGYIVQGFFALSQVLQNKGIFPLPSSTSKVAPVNIKDVAHGSARLLACHDLFKKHHKNILSLTGPQLYNGPGLVQVLNSTLHGSTRIEFQEVNLEEMKTILEKDSNLTESDVECILGSFELWKEGRLDFVSKDLEDILGGKKPTDVKQFFEENQDAFRPNGNLMQKYVLKEEL